ncbi:MAG: hypothetical protein ABI661_03555, partial [Gammaproteobacteria bacterium]
MSIHRIVVGLVLAVTLQGLIPSAVHAASINYLFSGTGSGSLGGNAINGAFTVSVNADSNDVAYQSSLGAFGLVNLSGTINIAGTGVATFTAPLFIFG